MTTRADIRTSVRYELNDSGGTPLWVSTLLDRWIVEAIRQWSADWPKQATTTLTSVANQAAYTLPADVLQVIRVEHPSGTYRHPGPLVSGELEPSPGVYVDTGRIRPGASLWETFGGSLILTPAPTASSESIVVRYMASYLEPDDDVDVLTVASRDEEALIYHVCASALAWIATDESKRMRFDSGRGAAPVDQVKEYRRRYDELLSRRRAGVRSRRLVPREDS